MVLLDKKLEIGVGEGGRLTLTVWLDVTLRIRTIVPQDLDEMVADALVVLVIGYVIHCMLCTIILFVKTV